MQQMVAHWQSFDSSLIEALMAHCSEKCWLINLRDIMAHSLVEQSWLTGCPNHQKFRVKSVSRHRQLGSLSLKYNIWGQQLVTALIVKMNWSAVNPPPPHPLSGFDLDHIIPNPFPATPLSPRGRLGSLKCRYAATQQDETKLKKTCFKNVDLMIL